MRGRRHRRTAVVLLVTVATAAAGCGGAGPSGAGDAQPFPAAPLASTLVAGDGAAWVTVPTGAPGSPFYQLVAFSPATGRWSLATPPGVATTGGLVLAGAGGRLVAAFVPAVNLGFSPLAASGDGGRSWSAPGTLPGPIAAAPDALAVSGDGSLLALVHGAGGGLETSAGAASAWHVLAGTSSIAGSAGGSACEVRALTAVVPGPDGALVGASCGRPGTVGVLAGDAGGAWQLTGPSLPAGTPAGTVEVLRLAPAAGGGDAALLGVAGATGRSLVAAWLEGGRWTTAPGVALRAGESLVASGTTPDGGWYVLLSRGGGGGALRLLVASSGGGWRTVPAPPAGTSAVAFLAGGRVDALVARGASFVDEVLAAAGGGWTPRQTITVPIGSGSPS